MALALLECVMYMYLIVKVANGREAFAEEVWDRPISRAFYIACRDDREVRVYRVSPCGRERLHGRVVHGQGLGYYWQRG